MGGVTNDQYIQGHYNYTLLTKHEVKMAGYWPVCLFFVCFLRFYGH